MKKGDSEYKKGLWTEEEDRILIEYIRVHGRRHWNRIPKLTGLMRNGKSCRLRWLNYLSPNVKHGSFSEEEDDLIIRLHNLLGNRWSLIAGRVPGRTDNQVKNHWNTHLCKKLGLNKQSRRLRDKAPSKPMASPHEEGTLNVHMTLNSAPSDSRKEKEVEVLDGQRSCLDNNYVAAMNGAQHWLTGESGIIKDNFDQSFMFEFDIGHNFVLDSPPAPGLMELFDGFDIL